MAGSRCLTHQSPKSMDATINTATDPRLFAHLFGCHFIRYFSGLGKRTINQAAVRFVNGSFQ